MEFPSEGRGCELDRPAVSIVVATRDRCGPLRICLETLGPALGSQDEVIVVDSASKDPASVRDIAQEFDARYLRCERPGAARARNLGIEHATRELVAFTDDDAQIDPGWLDALTRPFADPAVGIVVGPVFQLGQEPARLLTGYVSFDAARDRAVFCNKDEVWFERLRLGAVGSGANFAARRALFERHGRFRECLGAGAPIAGDETFFFFSAVAAGETLVNEPDAKVFHPEQFDDRVEVVLVSRVAYWFYAVFNFPRLAHRLVPTLIGRLRNGPTQSHGGLDVPHSSLLRAILHAPRLLFSAWRYSGWK